MRYSCRMRFALGLLLVDVPVIAVAALVGHDDPVGTVTAVVEWREQHPITLLASVPAVVLVAWRLTRRETR